MSIRFNKALMVGLIVAVSGATHAGPKEDQISRLSELSASIDQFKASGDMTALQAALSEQQSLSTALGGDSAVSTSGGRSVPAATRAISPSPADTTLTTVSNSSTPGAAITDNTTIQDTLTITSTDTYIWDVDLILNITHTFPGDLDITLTSPTGTVITVTTDNGGTADDAFAGTLFDDNAISIDPGNVVSDFTYTTGVLATPLAIESAFGALIGEDPNGTWTLSVGDDAGGDTGTLVDWTLAVSTLDQVPINDALVSSTSSPGTAITDNTTIQDTLVVTSPEVFLCDLNMTTDITHTFPGDLDITLTSPAGTVVTITTDNAGTSDDAFSGTVWDDSATVSANDFAHATGVTSTPLPPEASFAALIGEDPNGTWTLSVGDDAGGDTGTLNSWTLDVITCAGAAVGPPPVATAVPTMTVWGMLLMLLGVSGLVLLQHRRNRMF